MTKITIIEAVGPKSYGHTEVYYEPRAPRRVLRDLRRLGWRIRTRRVDAEARIGILERRAQAMRRESASLAGASSATHTLALGAASVADDIAAIRAAAMGRGNLAT